MADAFVRSTDGSDADNGTTWALAEATLAAALVDAGAGGRVFMSDNHAETAAAAVTETSSGVSGNPTAVICVDDTGDPNPPTALATTGSVSNTGANSISFVAHAACYGFTVNCSSGGSAGSINFTSANSWHWIFRSCVLVCRASASGNRILVGGTSGSVQEGLLELYATDVQFNGAAQAFNPAGPVKWYGGTLTSGTIPTGGLIKPLAGTSTLFEARGVDLGNMSTNVLMEVGQGAMGGDVLFANCKMGSGFTLSALTTGTYDGLGHARIRVHNCEDSSSHHFILMEKDHCGTIEATSGANRVGGASAGSGVFCHRMVSTAGATFYAPLYSPRYAVPIFQTGSSLTLTIEFAHDSATALKDDDIWYEIEYQGSSATPLSTFANGRRGILTSSGTNWGSSSVTWSGTGFTNENKQKMTVSFTPNAIGILYIRVGLSKASYTVLIDPPQRAQVA